MQIRFRPTHTTTQQVSIDTKEHLLQTARSTLNSKIINRHREHMAGICVDAVLAVCHNPTTTTPHHTTPHHTTPSGR